ncbi:MAG: SpoIIE family protein phosphatase [Spirochaetes bacterium]|nr:SpoIIE family protein phosphatase [Spirochaetota bacterium]
MLNNRNIGFLIRRIRTQFLIKPLILYSFIFIPLAAVLCLLTLFFIGESYSYKPCLITPESVENFIIDGTSLSETGLNKTRPVYRRIRLIYFRTGGIPGTDLSGNNPASVRDKQSPPKRNRYYINGTNNYLKETTYAYNKTSSLIKDNPCCKGASGIYLPFFSAKQYLFLVPVILIITGLFIWIFFRFFINRTQLLRKLNRLYQAIEHSTNVFIIADLNGTIEYINKRYEIITGYSKSTLIGKKLWNQPNIRLSAKEIREIKKCIDSKHEWHGELKVKKQDGSVFHAENTISLILDKHGSPIYYLSVITDITEEKQEGNTAQLLNEKMKKHLETAVKVQRSLLPPQNLSIKGMEFSWSFEPSEDVGGDIFDIFKLDESNIGFYILDVCGHGLKAAMLSVTLSRILTPLAEHSGLLKTYNNRLKHYRITPPAEIADLLNKRFQFSSEKDQFFTFLYGIFNLEKATFNYVSAGHPGFIYTDRKGKMYFPELKGFPIGFTDKPGYRENLIKTGPGYRFFFFSDGLTELVNLRGEILGIKSLTEIIKDSSSLPVSKVPDYLVAEAKRRTATKITEDDISCIVLEITREVKA